jgi:type II secretory pathway pseudopilin PulG
MSSNKKIQAFSLVEIIVSLALFSFVITAVVTLSIQMASTQRQIQAQLFLVQTAQTTLENMSRNLRYAYAYSGSTEASYNAYSQAIVVNTQDLSGVSGASASSTQILANSENSPFILFESQNGNPNSYADQNAFCLKDSKLYKVSAFSRDTSNPNFWRAACDSGYPMLPDNIEIEKISFDVYGGVSDNPKNPLVRIKMRIKHEEAGSLDIQTTITQRLVTYF